MFTLVYLMCVMLRMYAVEQLSGTATGHWLRNRDSISCGLTWQTITSVLESTK